MTGRGPAVRLHGRRQRLQDSNTQIAAIHAFALPPFKHCRPAAGTLSVSDQAARIDRMAAVSHIEPEPARVPSGIGQFRNGVTRPDCVALT